MLIKKIEEEERRAVACFIQKRWFSTQMAVRGQLIDMMLLDGFIAYDNGNIVGLITYRIQGNECEIMSLDSIHENEGTGTKLLKLVIKVAAEAECTCVKLITTNDNVNAMRFYQMRGFDMTQIYHGAVEAARELKPSIPLIGNSGIPIKHEIEFIYNLSGRKVHRRKL
jgi:GNAT superfamily N-acetyltransferase